MRKFLLHRCSNYFNWLCDHGNYDEEQQADLITCMWVIKKKILKED